MVASALPCRQCCISGDGGVLHSRVLWSVISYGALDGVFSTLLFLLVCCFMLDVIVPYCDVLSVQAVMMQCGCAIQCGVV